jgi:ATP-dependent helicase HrpA
LYLLFSPMGSSELLTEDIILTAIQRCFLEDAETPRNDKAFAELIDTRRDRFVAEANTLTGQLAQILALHADVRSRLNAELPLSWVEAARDIQAQIAALVYPGFLAETPNKWLQRLPRYLKAVINRMDKLSMAPDKDRLRRSQIEPLFVRLQQVSPKGLKHPERLLEYKWLLEELRVSLFAQELGSIEKVSVKRLDRLWSELC